MPISNNFQSTSIINNMQITPISNHSLLINQWEEWARNAQPGMGEKRDLALNRLKDCLERHADTLDLTRLKLTTLPANFPDHVEKLNISRNKLTDLPELPATLKDLDISLNKLTHLSDFLPTGLKNLDVSANFKLACLPETLPTGLKQLNAEYGRLTYLPTTLPDGLEKLNVRSNDLICLPETLPTGLKQLNVEDNKLTYLPETFPVGLRELNVRNNRLTYLPESLPVELDILLFWNRQLTHFPAVLPAKLKHLGLIFNQCKQWEKWTRKAQLEMGEERDAALCRLTDCLEHHADSLDLKYLNLTELPANLPDSVEELNVSYNQLTSLPELPAGLKQLDAANNLFAYLPKTLPAGLEKLSIANNQLTCMLDTLPSGLKEVGLAFNQLLSLPDSLPSGLRKLNVAFNQLIHLPERLPVGLRELNVRDNQLTRLPESLPAGLRLHAYNNPLSKPAQLIEILSVWDKNIDMTQWRKIAQEENARVFFDFLEKLHQESNVANIQLHYIVSYWLKDLSKDENAEVRRQTFAIAQEGTTSCVDRASYYFNQMHSLMITHRLIKEDISISEIFNTLRGLFRMQELEKIAASHVEQRRNAPSDFTEEIEIYLAYQYKLREELGLPVYIELQFEGLADATTKDLESARNRILEKEKQGFLRYLVNDSEEWQKRIGRWNSEKMALVNESYLNEIISPHFQQNVENALRKEGISVSDEDALRIMNQKMADDLLYQKRYLLMEEFLRENNALSLLNGLNR